MSSQRRIDSSRANGAKSHGPITPEGKRISSRNAIIHGLSSDCADCVVMQGERREGFLDVLDQLLLRFQPADQVEHALVEEMAAAYWRQRRAWTIETDMFNEQTALEPQGGLAGAFARLAAAGPALALIHRYEARQSLAYQRSMRTLLQLREKVPVPNEPNPVSEHPPNVVPIAPCPPVQPIDSEPLGETNPRVSAENPQLAYPVRQSPDQPPDDHPGSRPDGNTPGGAA